MLHPNDHETSRINVKRAKILVIEDSDDHWVLIKNAIELCFAELTPIRVETPDQAMTLLNDWSSQEWEIPKLILQDLYLPGREDGWKLLEQIKAMPAPCNRIPVVILSSSNYRLDINEAYQRGSALYMVKPIDFKEWLTCFRELRTYWLETVTLPPLQFSV